MKQSIFIKITFEYGVNIPESHGKLVERHGQDVLSYPSVCYWRREFHRGHPDVDDKPKSGRPADLAIRLRIGLRWRSLAMSYRRCLISCHKFCINLSIRAQKGIRAESAQLLRAAGEIELWVKQRISRDSKDDERSCSGSRQTNGRKDRRSVADGNRTYQPIHDWFNLWYDSVGIHTDSFRPPGCVRTNAPLFHV
jgi:hypothetical protein